MNRRHLLALIPACFVRRPAKTTMQELSDDAPVMGTYQDDPIRCDLKAYLREIKNGPPPTTIHLWYDYDLSKFRFTVRRP